MRTHGSHPEGQLGGALLELHPFLRSRPKSEGLVSLPALVFRPLLRTSVYLVGISRPGKQVGSYSTELVSRETLVAISQPYGVGVSDELEELGRSRKTPPPNRVAMTQF